MTRGRDWLLMLGVAVVLATGAMGLAEATAWVGSKQNPSASCPLDSSPRRADTAASLATDEGSTVQSASRSCRYDAGSGSIRMRRTKWAWVCCGNAEALLGSGKH